MARTVPILPLMLLLFFTGATQQTRGPFWARPEMTTEEAREVQRATARHFDLPDTLSLEITDTVVLELVLIWRPRQCGGPEFR